MERGNTWNFGSLPVFGEKKDVVCIELTEKFNVIIGGMFKVWNERPYFKEVTSLCKIEFK